MLMSLFAVLRNASCNSATQEIEEAVKYSVTSPLKVDTSFTREYVSQIKSVRNIELRAQEKGYLQDIYVDEGQFVKAGQLLFRIMPKIYEAELLKAQAGSRISSCRTQRSSLKKMLCLKMNLQWPKPSSTRQMQKLHLQKFIFRSPKFGRLSMAQSTVCH